MVSFFFFQAEDGIRYGHVTGVQTCALPIFRNTCSADWISRRTCSRTTGSSSESASSSRRTGAVPADSLTGSISASHRLVHEVMQPVRARVADVHRGALADQRGHVAQAVQSADADVRVDDEDRGDGSGEELPDLRLGTEGRAFGDRDLTRRSRLLEGLPQFFDLRPQQLVGFPALEARAADRGRVLHLELLEEGLEQEIVVALLEPL